MKIAYVCQWDPFVEDGVVKKVNAQVKAWRALGAEAEVFCVGPSSRRPRPQKLGGRTFVYRRKLAGRARATLSLRRAIRAYAPDLVYVRYSLFLPPLTYARTAPTVVEVNSNDRREYRVRGRNVLLYNEINRRLLFARARGLACVTDELATSQDFSRFGKPSRAISNGIDLQVAEPLPPAGNEHPRAAFMVGSPGPWHGVDKILRLARELPNIDFEIIGVRPADLPEVQPPNVTTHPPLSRHEYEPILARCDLALATLALHRKGMTEAAPLKVREYLLYGLPVVLAYEDPDLREPAWFVLRIPNTDANVRDHAGEIGAFAVSVAGRRVPRQLVAPRLDLLAKEAERLQFFGEVLAGAAQRSAAE